MKWTNAHKHTTEKERKKKTKTTTMTAATEAAAVFNQLKHMKSIVAHICRAFMLIKQAKNVYWYTDCMQALNEKSKWMLIVSVCVVCVRLIVSFVQSFIHSLILSFFIGAHNVHSSIKTIEIDACCIGLNFFKWFFYNLHFISIYRVWYSISISQTIWRDWITIILLGN